MGELITIIVPVYNTQKYLSKCINSILKQTYRNIEIIIVNDGSTDNSSEMCNSYLEKDSRIIVLHNENMGVSFARNQGLEICKGQYVLFIDSDDWLEENMVEMLYYNLKKYDCDISVSNYFINNEKGEEFSDNANNQIFILDELKEMYEFLLGNDKFKGYLWNKLIKRDLIEKEDRKIEFRNDVKIQEDSLFLIEVFEDSKRICYDSNKKLYHYLKRKNSAVRFDYSTKDLSRLIVLKKEKELKDKFNLKGLNTLEYEYTFLAKQAIYIIKKEGLYNKELKEKIKMIGKKYFNKAFKQSSLKQKMKLCIITIMPTIYGMLSDKRKNRV